MTFQTDCQKLLQRRRLDKDGIVPSREFALVHVGRSMIGSYNNFVSDGPLKKKLFEYYIHVAQPFNLTVNDVNSPGDAPGYDNDEQRPVTLL